MREFMVRWRDRERGGWVGFVGLCFSFHFAAFCDVKKNKTTLKDTQPPVSASMYLFVCIGGSATREISTGNYRGRRGH